MMKRILVLISILTFAGTIFAQPVDYLIKAKALKESGKNGEAISLLSEGVIKYKDYRFLTERGDVLIAMGDLSAARADFEAANILMNLSGEYGLARIFAIKGDAANSLKHLENSINSVFKKGEKEIMLDNSFSSIENTPEWRLFWKKDRYSFLEMKISEIEFYVSQKKSDDAFNVLNDLTAASYTDDPQTQYAKALVYFSQGKNNECIAVLSKLMEKDKTNETYLRLLAKAQAASGNHAGATQSYSELIGMGIPDADLYMLRAESYYKTGETDMALNDVSKFLVLYPEDRNALSFAGRVAAQSGDNLKAIDYFTKNLKLHPNDAECYIDRANSYFVSKTWDSAISDYSMALDIQPSNSDTWLNKGISLIGIGKKEDACHDFNSALNLGNKKASSYISRYCIK